MKVLILYLGIVVVGYIVGSKLRKKKVQRPKWIGPVQTVSIIVLLLVMGIRLGANKEVISGIGSIGLTAFVTVILAMAGSVGAVFLARKIMKIDKKGEKVDD